ncbi:TPA: DUF551 domain-containing protein [Serratia marcescens]
MTLTTERLREIASSPSFSANPLSHEVKYMARELLANREAQPVFFIEIEGDDWINAGRIESKNRPDLGLLPDGINYLYAAPPAPAVNASPDFETWFVEKYKQPERLMKNGDGAYKFSGVQMAFSAWVDGRAAMLAAAPDAWIACSERVPDADGVYWCWFGKEEPSVIQQRVCIWNNRNHEWCDSAVTHWMPLPVAPEASHDNS